MLLPIIDKSTTTMQCVSKEPKKKDVYSNRTKYGKSDVFYCKEDEKKVYRIGTYHLQKSNPKITNRLLRKYILKRLCKGNGVVHRLK